MQQDGKIKKINGILAHLKFYRLWQKYNTLIILSFSTCQSDVKYCLRHTPVIPDRASRMWVL